MKSEVFVPNSSSPAGIFEADIKLSLDRAAQEEQVGL